MERKSSKFVSLASKGFVILIGIVFFSMMLGNNHVLAASSAATTSEPGFFQHYFVQPMTYLINTVADWFGGNYGLSIILITLFIRFLLMPLMVKSSKSQYEMRDKMAVVQPQMKIIQDKMKKATTQDAKAKLNQELMELYKKNNINPMASLGGCLPLFIQMPILMGFYYAIRGSAEISSHNFLWFSLGSPDYILMILAVGVYFIQSKISMMGMPEEQKKQMAFMNYLSPVMIGMISFSAPAALPLYWIVGGIFMIIQTYIIRKIYSPNKETVGVISE